MVRSEAILDHRFRANPDYELVCYNQLPEEQKELFHDLEGQAEFYGILRPRRKSLLGVKSMSCEAALLFLTLQKPGPLPTNIRTVYKDESFRVIGQLLLDGVLQIDHNGTFLMGCQVASMLELPEIDVSKVGVLAELSQAALRYGQNLAIDDITRLSARIYFYNRFPVTPELRCQFPSARSVATHLHIGAGSPARNILDAEWVAAAGGPVDDTWLMWRHRLAREDDLGTGALYKLYVSPSFAVLGDVVPVVIDVLTKRQVACFKVGADMPGLLRPDKFVAYFSSFVDLTEAAEELAGKLVGVPAHGVPFTAELTDTGMLSWGLDPPRNQQALGWQERESWRLWITNRLAAAVLVARSAPGPVEAWQFALRRLQWEGIDTKAWAAGETLWS